jgi:hypothetical protein
LWASERWRIPSFSQRYFSAGRFAPIEDRLEFTSQE